MAPFPEKSMVDGGSGPLTMRMFQAVLEHANDAILITTALLDPPGPEIVYVNPAFCRMTGYAPDEVVGRTPRLLQGPATDREVLRQLRRQLELEEPSVGEIVNYRKDGTPFRIEWTIFPLRDDAGRLSHWVAVQRDITERAALQAALQEREQYFRALIENATDLITVVNADETIRYESPSARRALGYEPEEMVGQKATALVHPNDQMMVRALFDYKFRHPGEPVTLNFRCRHRDGTWRHIEGTSVNLLEDPVVRGILVNSRDVTERRKAEEERDGFFNVSLDMLCIAGFDGYFKRLNPAWERVVGYSIEELLARPYLDFVHPDDHATTAAEAERLTRGGPGTLHFENRYLCRNGSVRWFRWNSVGSLDHKLIYGVAHDVTEGRRVKEALQASEARYRQIFERDIAANSVSTPDGRLLACNDAFVSLFGFASRDEALAFPLAELYPAREERAAILEQLRQHRALVNHELHLRRVDGNPLWVATNAIGVFNEAGELTEIQSHTFDLTERRRAEAARARLAALVQSSPDAIKSVDLDGRVTSWNAGAERLYGYRAEEMVGQPAARIVPPHLLDEAQRLEAAVLRGERVQNFETLRLRADGTLVEVAMTLSPIWDAGGALVGISTICRDISDRRRAEEQLRRTALYDSLTGLANRALFMAQLDKVIARSHADPRFRFAVLYVDLDRFKVVNDSLGHSAGDAMLIEVARRLREGLRPEDTAARIGGDEFALLLEEVADESEVLRGVARLQQRLSQPIAADGLEFFATASIGIAFGTAAYQEGDEVLRDADIAMMRAKMQRGGSYEMFDAAMHSRAREQLRLENDLRRAVRRGELRLSFQPIVALATGQLAGFEALARWQHPELGLVLPGEFIPLAEESGLITLLDRWALRAACAQGRAWQATAQAAGVPPPFISVNVSAKHFAQADFVVYLAQTLEEAELEADALRLEITESVLMENTESAAFKLVQLRAMGVHLHMDDFGTGFSSLNYLHRFPVDGLKVDRTFISGRESQAQNWAIVQAIVALARALGREVAAEGIENPEQLARLRAEGCDYGQGYLFAPPLPPDEATALLAADRRW